MALFARNATPSSKLVERDTRPHSSSMWCVSAGISRLLAIRAHKQRYALQVGVLWYVSEKTTRTITLLLRRSTDNTISIQLLNVRLNDLGRPSAARVAYIPDGHSGPSPGSRASRHLPRLRSRPSTVDVASLRYLPQLKTNGLTADIPSYAPSAFISPPQRSQSIRPSRSSGASLQRFKLSPIALRTIICASQRRRDFISARASAWLGQHMRAPARRSVISGHTAPEKSRVH